MRKAILSILLLAILGSTYAVSRSKFVPGVILPNETENNENPRGIITPTGNILPDTILPGTPTDTTPEWLAAQNKTIDSGSAKTREEVEELLKKLNITGVNVTVVDESNAEHFFGKCINNLDYTLDAETVIITDNGGNCDEVFYQTTRVSEVSETLEATVQIIQRRIQNLNESFGVLNSVCQGGLDAIANVGATQNNENPQTPANILLAIASETPQKSCFPQHHGRTLSFLQTGERLYQDFIAAAQQIQQTGECNKTEIDYKCQQYQEEAYRILTIYDELLNVTVTTLKRAVKVHDKVTKFQRKCIPEDECPCCKDDKCPPCKEKPQDCTNPTRIDPTYKPDPTRNTYNDEAILLKDQIIFYNNLQQDDTKTVQLLKGQDLFYVTQDDRDGASRLGFSPTNEQAFIFTPQLPWVGTFALNFIAPFIDLYNGDFAVYSTDRFTITVGITRNNLITYTVLDNEGRIITILRYPYDTAAANYWPDELTDNGNLFQDFLVNKVELFLNGAECHLRIIAPNDVAYTSDVFGCLEARPLLNREFAAQAVRVRDHFGPIRLGYNGATKTLNPANRYIIGAVYLLATHDSPAVLRHRVKGHRSTDDTKYTDGTCEVSFAWNKLNINPINTVINGNIILNNDEARTCETYNTRFGDIRVLRLNHAFKNVPNYFECGTVEVNNLDQSTRTHLCNPTNNPTDYFQQIAYGETLNLLDLTALATNFGAYNPIARFVQVGDRNDAELFFPADKGAALHAIIVTPNNSPYDIRNIRINFDVRVPSFPHKILNAVNPNPSAKLTFKVRVFGQTFITVEIVARRCHKDQKEDDDCIRLFKTVTGQGIPRRTFEVRGSANYAAQLLRAASQNEVTLNYVDIFRCLEETIKRRQNGTADKIRWEFGFAGKDFISRQIEVSFVSEFCAGAEFGCYRPEYQLDRAAVFQVANFTFALNQGYRVTDANGATRSVDSGASITNLYPEDRYDYGGDSSFRFTVNRDGILNFADRDIRFAINAGLEGNVGEAGEDQYVPDDAAFDNILGAVGAF